MSTATTDHDVVVVGGGIAGLGAAHTLAQQGVDVVVLEREAEAGGRMRSRQAWDGLWFDLGAEHLTSKDTAFLGYMQQYGLEDQKVKYLDTDTGMAFQIYRGGQSYEFDMTRPSKMLRYGAISRRGRAQIAKLLPAMVAQTLRNHGSTFEPWRAAKIDDQSVEEWVGRLAPEFLEYALEPMWDIVCGWDVSEISRGFMVYIMTAYHQSTGFTLREGAGAITRALASALDVRTGTAVTEVDVVNRTVTFETVGAANGGRRQQLKASAVLVATPGHVVRDVVTGLDAERAAFFDGVRYQAHDNCFFKLSDKAEELDLPNRGFYPRKEHGELSGIGYGVVPSSPEHRVLRAGLKGRFSTELADRPDAELEAAIMARVSEVEPEIPPLVEDRLLCRWKAALPIFYPGYLRALDRFVELEPIPGVAFAGDYLALCATAAAHDSGQRAASKLLADLS
jgi:oxygen-dependent protoporphyrinogen oxidase